MQTRLNGNLSSTSTTLSSMNTVGSKKTENVGARLVAFASHYSKSTLNSTNGEVKHHYVPPSEVESDRFFDLFSTVLKLVCLLLQYLLIYKSEKWLGPYFSSTDSFVHWQHMDFYMIIILILICVSSEQRLIHFRLLISLIALVYSCWVYSWKSFLIFTYPIVCSVLVIGCLYPYDKISSFSSNNIPAHWCSDNAIDLRNETNCLRSEFNHRLRFVLLSSFITFYYVSIIPLAFCDTKYIYFDLAILIPYGCIILLSSIMLNAVRYFPLELLTVFHRNGQHLGNWTCLENYNSTHPTNWDEKSPQSYEPNSIVRHKRQFYRSSAKFWSVAEPGNVCHSRFAVLFSRPFMFSSVLCCIQIILLFTQVLQLLFDRRWFVHFTQMIVFLFNTYSLRSTIRDMYLLYLVYCRE